MEIGVVMARDVVAREEMRTIAVAADELGLHSLWLTEHIAVPVEINSRYPYSADGRPPFGAENLWHESMVALGYLAGVTERIRLGTAVIPLFNRDPLSLAKQAASLDVLSGGRLELGLGAGWLVEEAQLLGHPHDHRGARLDECIDILRKAWAQKTFEHHGRFWDYPSRVGVHPQPVQGDRLPIWIGGSSERALKTTAERAIGNLFWYPRPEDVAAFRQRLDALRPGLKLAVSMRLGPDSSEKAEAISNNGADLLLLMDAGPAKTVVDNLRRFSREVAPAL
jgi:probable F420-dependent oxidoreductase